MVDLYYISHFRPKTSFKYKKAIVEQEKGGQTFRVVDNIVKLSTGRVEKTTYESGLPSKTRAVRVAKILNDTRPEPH